MKRISVLFLCLWAMSMLTLGEAGGRPLAFEANRGQTDERVKFLARGDGYSLFLASSEAVLALKDNPPLRLRWEGARPTPGISGERELPGRSYYLIGDDPAKWRTGIPSFEKVRYQGIYPGVDLVFYGNPRQLEYDFEIAPGADPGRIRLALEGADRVETDAAGDLVLHLGRGEVRLKKPVSYQEIEGPRQEVASRWRRTGPGRWGFEVGKRDPARPLVIDPVLAYSTYLGGNAQDDGLAIAVDAAGSAYVTGYTLSTDFPLASALRSAPAGGYDAFVTKLNPDGSLAYSTYLGGNRAEWGEGIGVDAAGNAYVGGWTFSSDFPLVNPLPPPSNQLTGGHAFVAKLASDGSSLVYSTKLGGSGLDSVEALAVDSQGHAYVTGETSSLDFPRVNPLPSGLCTGDDAFIAKLSLGGSSLEYSTCLGGSSFERGRGIAVDAAGQAYVTGLTRSADFPVVNAAQPAYGGTATSQDAFVTKISASGSSIVYSTYLGGGGSESGEGIAVDAAGNAFVAGYTGGAFDFPIKNPLPLSLSSNLEFGHAFLTRLGPSGALLSSTLLGGHGGENAWGVALDPAGNIYVAGHTFSADFPLKDPIQSECRPFFSPPYQCYTDAFVLELNPQASQILFSTYLGGKVAASNNPEDLALGIAVDPKGDAYVTGVTKTLDFPTQNAFQPSLGGLEDGFVTKIALSANTNRPPDCSAAFTSPSTLWPPNGKLVPVTIQNVIDPDGDPVTITVTGVRQDEPTQGTPNAFGIGTPNVSLRADRDGKGDGRVYRLSFSARDPQGASCTGTVTVCVPHDQGRGKTCGDGGGLFSSGG